MSRVNRPGSASMDGDEVESLLLANHGEVHIHLDGIRHDQATAQLVDSVEELLVQLDEELEMDEVLETLWFPETTILRLMADDLPPELIRPISRFLAAACADLDVAVEVLPLAAASLLPPPVLPGHEVVVVWESGHPSPSFRHVVATLPGAIGLPIATTLRIVGPLESGSEDAFLQGNAPLNRPTLTWIDGDGVPRACASLVAPRVVAAYASSNEVRGPEFTRWALGLPMTAPEICYVGGDIDIPEPYYCGSGFRMSRDVWSWSETPRHGVHEHEWVR